MADALPSVLVAVAALGVLAGFVAFAARRLKLFRAEKTTTQIRVIPDPSAVSVSGGASELKAPRLRETSAPAWAARKIDLTKPVTTIGRSIESDIVLAEDAVSVKHCKIERSDGRFRITDLGSTNKTFVNGVTVRASPLNHGDQIRVGGTTFIFESPDKA